MWLSEKEKFNLVFQHGRNLQYLSSAISRFS